MTTDASHGTSAGDDDLLYHYTTLDGLQGILSSSTVRATDIRYLNDSEELSFGALPIARVLHNLADTLPPRPGEADPERYGVPGDHEARVPTGIPVRAVANQILGLAGEEGERERQLMANMPLQWNWANVYVACFTDAHDSLLHWRGYGAGDGFAIGFDRAQLGRRKLPYWIHEHGDVIDPKAEDAWLDGVPVSGPTRVRYGEDAIEWIERFSSDLASEDMPQEVPFWSALTQYLEGTLPLCATVKHGAYEPESEWRLIACKPGASPKLKFRRGLIETGGVVPYLDVPFDKSAVKSVLVGPGQAMDLRVRAVRQMVEAYGYGYADSAPYVVQSTVPFRSS